MKKPQPHFRVGDPVRVRRQLWRVIDVRSYTGCQVVTLAGAGALNAGVGATFVTPFDVVDSVVRSSRVRLVGMRRWRRACRSLLATHGPADRLQTASRARIDLLPHQLEPALAIVRGLACRVLIADEVGLGKTIQAGLIISELSARGAVDRVLVLAPAGLREQWAAELRVRFGLAATIMDMAGVRKRAAELPVGVNPWATIGVAAASFDYIKRPEVLPAVASCRWDLVVVDEAHGVTAGSDRREAVAAICGRASYVVLLTATPHSGSRTAFDALCGIGARPGDRFLVFRRSREEVSLGRGRRVHRLFVRPNADERGMHARLSDFTRAVAAEAPGGNRDGWLALSVLHKRALSSARSLEQSVARRLAALDATESPESVWQMPLPLDGATGELDPADEPPAWQTPSLGNAAAERRLLSAVAGAAGAAALSETKLACLQRLLRRLARLREAAIVFTEYRDTLLHVRRALRCDCAVLHGALTRDERRSELHRFTTGRLRVLLATDAAGEGLNLHGSCRVVVNLELPWNPMRLEQRIGRVDRIGQRRRVHVFHLIARDTGETTLFDCLKQKIARARADIATADPLGGSGEDQEKAIARAVIGVEPRGEDDSGALDDPDAPTTAHAPVRFSTEAVREYQRLVFARTLSGPSDDRFAATDERLAAFVRIRTRARLGGRMLALLYTCLEDTRGRLVASRLTPVLGRPSVDAVAADRRAAIGRLVDAVEASAPLETLDDGDWHESAKALYDAFCSARCERARGILASLGDESPLIQAGLFDARGLGRATQERGRLAELRADLERLIVAAPPAALERSPTRAVLVLLPSGLW